MHYAILALFLVSVASALATTTPNDPLINQQLQLHLQDGGIGAPEAWDTRHDASNVIVAIISGGIRITHEDLRDNIWVNAGEISGNGIDDDGNGYVDDVNGWNFDHNSNDVTDGGRNPATGAAGVVGAVGNNGKGGAGVAWDVQIMPIRCDDSFPLEGPIQYALDNGARIILLPYAALEWQEKFGDLLESHDALIVTHQAYMANEDPWQRYPRHPHVVAAIDKGRWFLGADGNPKAGAFIPVGALDFLYMGPHPLTTAHTADDAYEVAQNQARALVAGSLALLAAQYPSEGALRIKERLLAAASDHSGKADGWLIGGVFNIENMFQAGEPTRPQQITVTGFHDISLSHPTDSWSASSSSGLPVEMEVVSGDASFVDGVFTPLSTGIVKVRFSQAGNETYNPARERLFTLIVTPPVHLWPEWNSIKLPAEHHHAGVAIDRNLVVAGYYSSGGGSVATVYQLMDGALVAQSVIATPAELEGVLWYNATPFISGDNLIVQVQSASFNRKYVLFFRKTGGAYNLVRVISNLSMLDRFRMIGDWVFYTTGGPITASHWDGSRWVDRGLPYFGNTLNFHRSSGTLAMIPLSIGEPKIQVGHLSEAGVWSKLSEVTLPENLQISTGGLANSKNQIFIPYRRLEGPAPGRTEILIYEANGSNWTQLESLKADDGYPFNYLGNWMLLDGEKWLAASGGNDLDSIYIFGQQNGVWEQVARIPGNAPFEGVAIVDDTLYWKSATALHWIDLSKDNRLPQDVEAPTVDVYADGPQIQFAPLTSEGQAVRVTVEDGSAQYDDYLELHEAGTVTLKLSHDGDYMRKPAAPIMLQLNVLPGWRRSYDQWIAAEGLSGNQALPFADPYGLGTSNLAMWTFGGSIASDRSPRGPVLETRGTAKWRVETEVGSVDPQLVYVLQQSSDLENPVWTDVATLSPEQVNGKAGVAAEIGKTTGPRFYRIVVRLEQ